MNSFEPLKTPCSNGINILECPHYNYILTLYSIGILLKDLICQYDIPFKDDNGCLKCNFYTSLREIEPLNRLALLELPKRGGLNSRET